MKSNIKVGDIVSSIYNPLFKYKVIAKRGRWVDVVAVPSESAYYSDKFTKQPVSIFKHVY